MRLLITTLNFKIIRKLFRFLWRLLKLCVVLALGLNSLTFIVLSYRKADDAFVEECSRTVVTRFPTVLHVRDGQAGDVEGREGDAEPLSREIPAGTEVKVLAVYAEGFSGRVKPHWNNVHQDWYVELEDGSRGHAVLPEACIGTVCEDPEGNRMEIRDVRRRNAETEKSGMFCIRRAAVRHGRWKICISLCRGHHGPMPILSIRTIPVSRVCPSPWAGGSTHTRSSWTCLCCLTG